MMRKMMCSGQCPECKAYECEHFGEHDHLGEKCDRYEGCGISGKVVHCVKYEVVVI